MLLSENSNISKTCFSACITDIQRLLSSQTKRNPEYRFRAIQDFSKYIIFTLRLQILQGFSVYLHQDLLQR